MLRDPSAKKRSKIPIRGWWSLRPPHRDAQNGTRRTVRWRVKGWSGRKGRAHEPQVNLREAATGATWLRMGRAACGRWPRRLHARIRSCVGMRGGGFRPCPMRRMAERPCLTAVGHRRPRKSAVAPGPMLSERLRRLTSAGRGTPGRDHGSRPLPLQASRCQEHGEGWSCGRPRASMPQLGGRDEALPQEAPEGSSTSCSLPRESTCRRLRYRTKNVDGAPNPHAFARANGRPSLAEIGESIMRWTQGHEGGLMVGKKPYVK